MNIFGCFPTVWWAISVNLLTPHRLPPVCFPKCGRIFESNELPWEYFLWKKKRKILPRFLPLFAMPSLPHFEASPSPHWPVRSIDVAACNANIQILWKPLSEGLLIRYWRYAYALGTPLWRIFSRRSSCLRNPLFGLTSLLLFIWRVKNII